MKSCSNGIPFMACSQVWQKWLSLHYYVLISQLNSVMIPMYALKIKFLQSKPVTFFAKMPLLHCCFKPLCSLTSGLIAAWWRRLILALPSSFSKVTGTSPFGLCSLCGNEWLHSRYHGHCNNWVCRTLLVWHGQDYDKNFNNWIIINSRLSLIARNQQFSLEFLSKIPGYCDWKTAHWLHHNNWIPKLLLAHPHHPQN